MKKNIAAAVTQTADNYAVDSLPSLHPLEEDSRSKELDRIIVRGAKEHNLKNIDVEIPKKKAGGSHGCFRVGQVQPGL